MIGIFRKGLILVVVIVGLLAHKSYSTHIVGGELNYRYLGGNNYEITLKVYRDCFNGVPPFDPIAAVGIFDINDSLLDTLMIVFPGSEILAPVLPNPCIQVPTDICVEATQYVDTVNLPSIPGGYQLAYQRCCRNRTIANLIKPENTGATYYAYIPDTSVADTNSNPIINEWPPIFLCVDEPFTFDHSAIDLDGDSLVYEICDPFHGGETAVCNPPGQPVRPQPCGPQPQPPFNPPYDTVVWQAPYGLNNLLGGDSAAVYLKIDSATGLLTAIPNTVGQFVVGICVNEYRDGLWLSATKRDFQFNVRACQKTTVAAAVTQNSFCDDHSIGFINNSSGAVSYDWDFGDVTTDADTSHDANPLYTYPDTGSYVVSLIAYSGVDPSCNDTLEDLAVLSEILTLQVTKTDALCKGLNNGSATAVVAGGDPTYNFSWAPNGSAQSTVAGLGPGIYTVTVSDDKGCDSSMTIEIFVGDSSVADFDFTQELCDPAEVQFNNLSSNSGGSYSWNLGVAGSITKDENPDFSYPGAGTYVVTLTAVSPISSLCNDTKQSTVTVTDPLSASATSTNTGCGSCDGSATVVPVNGTSPIVYQWDDPAAQTTAVMTGQCQGQYTVIVTDSNGCDTTVTITIDKFGQEVADFDVSASGCWSYTAVFNNLSSDSSGVSYLWDFGDTDSSNSRDPFHDYTSGGTYEIELVVRSNDDPTCNDTVTRQLTLYDSLKVSAMSSSIGCDGVGDGSINVTASGSNPPYTFVWDSLPDTTGTLTDLDEGNYTVTITDNSGCDSSLTINVSVAEPSEANFEAEFTPHCDHLTADFTNLSLDSNITYIWEFSDGTNSTELNPEKELKYGKEFDVMLIALTDDCQDTMRLTDKYKFEDFIDFDDANVFTPNGDGVNECFTLPVGDENIFECSELVVYNRWGTKMFDSEEEGKHCWDGTNMNNGKDCNEGVYYFIYGIYNYSLTGVVHLIRGQQ